MVDRETPYLKFGFFLKLYRPLHIDNPLSVTPVVNTVTAHATLRGLCILVDRLPSNATPLRAFYKAMWVFVLFCHVIRADVHLQIAIDSAVFPEGTSGHQLDVLARRALWKDGMNYLVRVPSISDSTA